MFRLLFILVLPIFSLFSVKLLALEVNDLYQVTIAVDSQTVKQREQAITKALQGVFLKIGGKKSVLQHKLLRQAQQKAGRYLNQYRYQRKDGELSLVVSFNENKVNALFKQADLALWGSLRPQVLLWLLDEQGAKRSIVAYDGEPSLIEKINAFSVQRGLPIIMPLMDLTDREQVQLSDFWGYFPERIQQASSRYFADTVVVMRISDSSLLSAAARKNNSEKTASTAGDIACGLLCKPDESQQFASSKVLDWKVYTQGALYTQQYQGSDKVNLITQGLSDITELIYQSYALSATAENDFVIEVNNVTDLTADTKLFDFLADLSAVKSVTLISAQADIRHFKLELIGSKNSLLASLKLNSKLTQTNAVQLENSLDSQSFNFDSESLLGSLSTENKGMRVIVLGTNTDASTEVDKNAADTTLSRSEKISAASTENNQQAVIDGSVLSDDTDSETIANGQVLPLLDEKKPLLIVPSIPVFYWEQG